MLSAFFFFPLFSNYNFLFQAVWNSELEQSKTCFISTWQATITKPQSDSSSSTDGVIPDFLLPMQSISMYKETMIKINATGTQIPSLLMITTISFWPTHEVQKEEFVHKYQFLRYCFAFFLKVNSDAHWIYKELV